ncbi:MAG: ABC transporter, partial [Glutamicibacter sp.]
MAPRNNLVNRLSESGARFKALPAGSKIALAFLLAIAAVALFAPLIAPHDPLATGIPAQKPSAEHFFGTDRLGRDIYSRLLFGAQASLLVGLGSVA